MKNHLLLFVLLVTRVFDAMPQATSVSSNLFKIRFTYWDASHTYLDDAVLCYANATAISTTNCGPYDAVSLNYGTYIASLKGSTACAIQGRPMSSIIKGVDSVSLLVAATSPGNYSISFSEMESFPSSSIIQLMDTYTGTVQLVNKSQPYSFTISADPASSGGSRFKLLIGSTAACANDNTPPAITAAAATKVKANHNGCSYMAAGSELDPAISDNCILFSVKNNYNNSSSLAGAVFTKGSTPVVWTATDASGNTATFTSVIIVENDVEVSIPAAIANAPGASENTIYYGYAPAATLAFTAQVNGNASGHKWQTSSNLVALNSNASSASVTATAFSATSDYSVTHSVTSSNGCVASTTKQIKVIDIRCGQQNKVTVCMPSKNGATVATCVSSSAVPQLLATGATLGSCRTMARSFIAPATVSSAVTVYPNPVTGGTVNLQLNNIIKGAAEVQLIDMMGKQVKTITTRIDTQEQHVSLNMSGYAAGVYQLRVVAADGTVQTTRLVVK